MRRIRYKRKRNRGLWGVAYPAEFRIEIDPELDDKTEIDIALHEGLHVLSQTYQKTKSTRRARLLPTYYGGLATGAKKRKTENGHST